MLELNLAGAGIDLKLRLTLREGSIYFIALWGRQLLNAYEPTLPEEKPCS
jgi:hypothetical protein